MVLPAQIKEFYKNKKKTFPGELTAEIICDSFFVNGFEQQNLCRQTR